MTFTNYDQVIDEFHHPIAHQVMSTQSYPLASRYKPREDSQNGARFVLGILFTIAELLLFGTCSLWLYWCYQFDEGLSLRNERRQQINSHATLMLTGFIFLNGQAMLIYRSLSCCSKVFAKIIHTTIFLLSSSIISLGLVVVYKAQENVTTSKPIIHFYSLHAWIGISTVGLFAFQFVLGFVSFLILLCCKRATSGFRSALIPIHRTFGLVTYSLAISTCLTGLLQIARSRMSSKLNRIEYHDLSDASMLLNMVGTCLICLTILIPYIIRNLDITQSTRRLSGLERHLKSLKLEKRMRNMYS